MGGVYEGDEEPYIGGFKVVTVRFEVNTPFGFAPFRSMCLIRSGKVAGWVPKVPDWRKAVGEAQ